MAVKIELDTDEEVDMDMTPMIDVIFQLIIFFILTMRFIPDEKLIASMLPTDKGQAAASVSVKPPENVNVLLYPAGMGKGQQPSFYDKQWKTNQDITQATLRIGQRAAVIIQGNYLDMPGNPDLKDAVTSQLTGIAGEIHAGLSAVETGGPRSEMPPVIIHCFSGLPWKYALAAYDAVRDYETQQAGSSMPDDPLEALKLAREVSFAPPRIRNYHTWELGNELFEIIHMR